VSSVDLFVVEGPDCGRRYVFHAPAQVTIGRSDSCEVPINDLKISRRHCRIDVEAGVCLVRDLASANGTRVNGVAIDVGPLEDGDKIRVGDSAIECSIGAGDGEPLSASGPAGYRFLEEIGAGAAGRVFRARQVALGRLVAVKVLPIAPGTDPRDVARFIRGARAEATLAHPHIVQVYDFFRTRDVYVVMELVEGGDLRRRGRLPPPDAVDVALQVCSALQYAFERGIVHRDVKPENVLLAPDGTAKLGDFGLAKSLLASGLSRITGPDEGGFGTPAYMPPEQLRSAATVDQRADVYSLGATLYCALAGAPPFAGPVADVVRRVERDPPPPLPPEVPPALAGHVLRAMAKDPAARFQTPRDFAAALAPFAPPRRPY
jgi:serine/threonine protein kinase